MNVLVYCINGQEDSKFGFFATLYIFRLFHCTNSHALSLFAKGVKMGHYLKVLNAELLEYGILYYNLFHKDTFDENEYFN